MSGRKILLAAATIFALMVGSGCTIHRDGDGVDLFGAGKTVEWDLSTPIEASSLTLPDDDIMYVDVPDDPTVTLKLPTGTWSGRTEEMSVTTRHGYLEAVNLYWTEANGQAAEDRMVADAKLLGVDASRVGQWSEVAKWAETADSNESTHKDNFNGSNGRVSTAIKPSMAIGEGEGTVVRLHYTFYFRDVVEQAKPEARRSGPTR